MKDIGRIPTQYSAFPEWTDSIFFSIIEQIALLNPFSDLFESSSSFYYMPVNASILNTI